jgi:hypothetical protein
MKRFVYFWKEFQFIFILRKDGNSIHKLVLPVIVSIPRWFNYMVFCQVVTLKCSRWLQHCHNADNHSTNGHNCENLKSEGSYFLSAFAKLRKVTVSLVVSVSLPTWYNSVPPWTGSREIWHFEYFSKIYQENWSFVTVLYMKAQVHLW